MKLTKRNAIHAVLCSVFVFAVLYNEPSWFERAINWLIDGWSFPNWGPQGVNPPPPPPPPAPVPPPDCCG